MTLLIIVIRTQPLGGLHGRDEVGVGVVTTMKGPGWYVPAYTESTRARLATRDCA